jgi:outer membrane protein assembly complex protein YaeT
VSARRRELAVAVLACALGGAALTGCTTLAGSAPPGAGRDGRPRYETVITGNVSVDATRLAQVAAEDFLEFERRGLKESAIDDAAYTIESHYLERGHPFARVTYTYTPAVPSPEAGETLPRAVLVVDEGPRTVLDELVLVGNTAFPDEDLLGLQAAPRSGPLGTGPPYYVEGRVDAQVAAIASLYWGAGYLRAQVRDRPPVFSEDRTRARVEIVIDEGIPYHVSRFDLVGEGPDGLAAPETLVREALAGYLDEPYFPQVGFAARARLLEFYAARGHPDARVAFDEQRDETTGAVVLTMSVEPGPVVTVSRIDVDGIERTQEAFVLERLALRPGETWSAEKQRQSEADLYRSGLFRTLRVELEPGEGASRALQVEVDERLPREDFIEPGYGSYEGVRVAAGTRDHNAFGGGRTVHLTGSLSSKAHRILAGITDPWFWDGSVIADLSVFQGRREEPSFTREDLGAAATIRRRHSARWQTTYGYTLRRSSVSEVDALTPPADQADESVNIGSLSVSPLYDSRDDLFAPTRGTLLRTALEGGAGITGSELDFLRGRVDWAWFTPLSDRTVLGVSFRTGIIAPMGGTDVIPLQERFFNGGENTVRSFTEDELGPKDVNGEALGGEAYSVFSIEARRPLSGNLEGALFYDLGNVEEDQADYFRFSNKASAIGVGLRYMLPIGPVRADWGVNPDPESGEDRSVLHVSVGMPF